MSYTLIQRVALYPDHYRNAKEPSWLVPVVKSQIVEKSPVIWVFDCEIDDRLPPQQTSRGEFVTWKEWLENGSGKAQLTVELHSDLGHFQLESKVHPKSHPSYYCYLIAFCSKVYESAMMMISSSIICKPSTTLFVL